MKKKKLKTYRVELEYSVRVRDEIEAASEEEAIKIAEEQLSSSDVMCNLSSESASATQCRV